MQGSHNDPLVVRRVDLARALERERSEQDEIRNRSDSYGGSLILGGIQAIQERCGLSSTSSRARQLFAPTSEDGYVSLTLADRILSRCGLNHLLSDGTIPVYQSPRYSDATFARMMRDRGIEGDPWAALDVRRTPAALAEAA